MPAKSLIRGELEKEGEVCALGRLGKVRGIDMSNVDPDEHEDVAKVFGIPHALACEIMYENDDREMVVGEFGEWRRENNAERWQRVRRWIQKHLAERP